MPRPTAPGTTIAYHSVRHFRGADDGQGTFSVHGWYEVDMEGSLIGRLAIRMQAMEGDPTILG